MTQLEELKNKGDAPEFLTQEALSTLSKGYLKENETPKDAYRRVAKYVAHHLRRGDYEDIFFDLIWRNWLCPSTPVLANSNTKGLPISCFSSHPADNLYSIMSHIQENVMLTKYGGGVGSSFDNLRPHGSRVGGGGSSSGVVPFLRMLETAIDGTTQGASRRGSVAAYLNIRHGDIESFIDIRKPTGDITQRCLTKAFHNAVTIDDEIMNEIKTKDGHYRNLWNKIMLNRVELGEPYILFEGNANKNTFLSYEGRVHQSNLCSEVMLPVTPEETFVCCLSSVNLAKRDEWENYICPKTGKHFIELCIYFLDGVVEGFIKQAEHLPGMENSVRFAKNHRALGLGVLGYHTLLQHKMIPFESFAAMQLNNAIFKQMRELADKATLDLGREYGECKETEGTGRRNTVTLAIAPTMSNSLLSGGVSQGIEPIAANLFAQKAAKGTFIKKNKQLETLLESKHKNTSDVWEQINKDSGSVRNLKFLSDDEKAVFATAREINQFAIVRQAGQRQKWIDQGVSTNLFFAIPGSKAEAEEVAKYINQVHLEAWELGVKSLYYLKTGSPIKGESVVKTSSDCVACEG